MAMVDFVKKIHKHCADDLEPGEQVLASTFGQPPGAIRRQVAWGAVGGAVGAIAGEALANKRIKDSEQNTGEGITGSSGRDVASNERVKFPSGGSRSPLSAIEISHFLSSSFLMHATDSSRLTSETAGKRE